MNTKFDGESVWAPKDATTLYEQNGYGRIEKDGRLRLDVREALYLIARGKIEVASHTFDTLLAECSKKPGFLRSFIVYRDIRERGYVITTGPQDFRIFARGQKPGHGTSRYLMRVLSERDVIDFAQITADAKAAANMRKTFILAVLDDEHELTYYEIRTGGLANRELQEIPGPLTAVLDGIPACILEDGSGITKKLEELWLGRMLDETRLFLSPVETAWLLEMGKLALTPRLSAEEYIALASAADSEFAEKLILYRSLKAQGFSPRSGYKFGHHFRVYTEAKSHSEMLIHAVPFGTKQSMSEISRSVRLAHSVRKKMLFACLDEAGNLTEIEFARMKM
ncbi:MAG TPA: tRNA-intron lyase [Methanocorpusculum sp.]|nr:tRNA-intron lyase [Methanocorpusculum sp.]